MRNKSIEDSLDYISQELNELGDELFEKMINKKDINHLSNKVGDILSNTTELFDHCAKDIIEKIVLPIEPNFKDKKVYFPFYKKQLEEQPFLVIRKIKPKLYEYLLKLANDAESKTNYENTCIPSNIPRKNRNLVNRKKHSDVIAISRGEESFLADLGKMKFTISTQQTGYKLNNPVMVGNGKLTKTESYILRDSGEEIFDICMKNKTITKIIIDRIYQLMDEN